MKELVISSGKGGTGKTSIAASFAALAGSAVLADCDVDAADLHLVTQPRQLEQHEFSGGKVAAIDPGSCSACGQCRRDCRFDAVIETCSGNKRSFRIDPIACEGCGVCRLVCPEGAVTLEEEIAGHWMVSDSRLGPLVHARLKPGGENSGKLVTLVRRRARELAEEKGAGLIITDGSPGIGCPVIASITGADLVLAVTEPTLSGRHDLERIASLAAQLRAPLAVAINKYDVNPEVALSIEAYADRQGLKTLGRIDYDPAVTAAQMAGLSVVESNEARASAQIRDLWKSVSELLSDPGA